MFSREDSKLFSLLSGASFEPGILALADAAEKILRDNQLPFFPAYTDHGCAHVHDVFAAAERLIPEEVWEAKLLEPADAAVLIGAVYLHDLGMHLREESFLELVSAGTAFKPLPWFDVAQDGRPADESWTSTWESFRREARHFTKSQQDRLLGPGAKGAQIAMVESLPARSEWTEADRLIIGEFIRRHHARLAHEIAIRGIPGIPAKEFPVLQDSVPQLADAIGATARSHNMNLRQAQEYLEYREPGNKRPDGSLQLYLMAVLRIADYFQLGSERAPPLLLHLRDPQSPQSVEEWRKNQAISSISWKNDDPYAIYIQVSPAHSLRTHLQVGELVEDLQRELDVSTAVLSESFGSTELKGLTLSRQRVRSNIDLPSLHERLSFIPRRARLRSDEDLFRLVISDLYGNVPAVAGRELLQNAVDAVRERGKWEAQHGTEVDPAELRDLPADVLVEVAEIDENESQLRIADKGIGMTASTVIEIFLTAGASFGAPRADDEQLESSRAIEWMKAGRFGVGAFAAFLLGSEVKVTTRHAGEARGVSFTASLDRDLVQLDWVEDAPVGTEIVVPYSPSVLPISFREDGEESLSKRHKVRNHAFLSHIASCYELMRPKVVCLHADSSGDMTRIESDLDVPSPGRRLPDTWRSLDAPGFDGVLWQVPRWRPGVYIGTREGKVTHNGIVIGKPGGSNHSYRLLSRGAGVVSPPRIAVFDSRQSLGIALNRYELTEPALPFEEALLRSIGLDVVAHALVFGARRHPLGEKWGLQPIVGRDRFLPLLPGLVRRYVKRDILVLWRDRSRWHRTRPTLPASLGSARQSPISWRDFPFRVSLSPERGLAHGPDVEAERDYLGISFEDVAQSISRLATSLGRVPVAATFVQSAGDPAWRPSAPPGLVRQSNSWLGKTAARPIKVRAEDAQLRGELTKLGKELVEGPEPHALGISVLRYAGQEEEQGHPLDDPWVERVGGLLERSPGGRDRRKDELAGRDRKLRGLIGKWERLAAD